MTVEAVEAADMDRVALELQLRVLGPLPPGPAGLARFHRLIDEPVGLRAFVELALREIYFAATVPGWPSSLRTRHALQALDWSGFPYHEEQNTL